MKVPVGKQAAWLGAKKKAVSDIAKWAGKGMSAKHKMPVDPQMSHVEPPDEGPDSEGPADAASESELSKKLKVLFNKR
jgi:hypothetical protein